MGKECVSREEAINACFNGWNMEPKDCANNIRKLPAVDAVKVVRCRECYFRQIDGVPVCTGPMAYSRTPDNWFCASGKPKNWGSNDD